MEIRHVRSARGDGSELQIELHPALTILTGLGADGRDAVGDLLAAVIYGEVADLAGWVELEGQSVPLSHWAALVEDRLDDFDVFVRAADLPGRDGRREWTEQISWAGDEVSRANAALAAAELELRARQQARLAADAAPASGPREAADAAERLARGAGDGARPPRPPRPPPPNGGRRPQRARPPPTNGVGQVSGERLSTGGGAGRRRARRSKRPRLPVAEARRLAGEVARFRPGGDADSPRPGSADDAAQPPGGARIASPPNWRRRKADAEAPRAGRSRGLRGGGRSGRGGRGGAGRPRPGPPGWLASKKRDGGCRQGPRPGPAPALGPSGSTVGQPPATAGRGTRAGATRRWSRRRRIHSGRRRRGVRPAPAGLMAGPEPEGERVEPTLRSEGGGPGDTGHEGRSGWPRRPWPSGGRRRPVSRSGGPSGGAQTCSVPAGRLLLGGGVTAVVERLRVAAGGGSGDARCRRPRRALQAQAAEVLARESSPSARRSRARTSHPSPQTSLPLPRRVRSGELPGLGREPPLCATRVRSSESPSRRRSSAPFRRRPWWTAPSTSSRPSTPRSRNASSSEAGPPAGWWSRPTPTSGHGASGGGRGAGENRSDDLHPGRRRRTPEVAHAVVADAEAAAARRMGGAAARRRLEYAQAMEAEVLERMGFSSYSAYLLRVVPTEGATAARTRLRQAERTLADAEAVWAEVERADLTGERAELDARQADLLSAVAATLGAEPVAVAGGPYRPGRVLVERRRRSPGAGVELIAAPTAIVSVQVPPSGHGRLGGTRRRRPDRAASRRLMRSSQSFPRERDQAPENEQAAVAEARGCRCGAAAARQRASRRY